MKKTYCIKCIKYKKFDIPEKLYTFKKETLFLSITCYEQGIKDEEIFKEELIEMFKTLGLIKNMMEYQINI